ncbi:MAG: ATP-binding cassette domain-containing protein, partial [Azospirillaceae bacterium]
LNEHETARLFAVLRELRAKGMTMLYVSHRLEEVFSISDRITVMRDGVSVATLDTAATDREAVVRHMVGETGSVRAVSARARRKVEETLPALEVVDIDVGRVNGVAFTARPGEIVGLGGLQGQGQSTLLRALIGALPWRDGQVSLDGKALRHRSPSAAMAHGFAYISGDRRRDGVFDIRPIFENAVAANLTTGRHPIVLRNRLIAQVSPVIDRLKLRFAGYRQPVGELSGGNQQKVVVARWLGIAPKVLLLDDPTKGIDLGAKADLYEELARLSAAGTIILLYSSEDAELLSVADRILVFNSGRIVRTLEGDEKTSHALTGAAFEAEMT